MYRDNVTFLRRGDHGSWSIFSVCAADGSINQYDLLLSPLLNYYSHQITSKIIRTIINKSKQHCRTTHNCSREYSSYVYGVCWQVKWMLCEYECRCMGAGGSASIYECAWVYLKHWLALLSCSTEPKSKNVADRVAMATSGWSRHLSACVSVIIVCVCVFTRVCGYVCLEDSQDRGERMVCGWVG